MANIILEGLTAFIVFLGLSIPVLIACIVYYLKKRLEHKQIMTAIEKGTPLSEIMPPKPKPAGPAWIRYLSGGIAMLVIGVAFIVGPRITGPGVVIAIVLCGIGLAWLIRGLLHRKYYLQNQLSDKSNAAENKDTPCVSTPETVQQTDK